MDQALRDSGGGLVLLNESASEDVLAAELRDADLLLMCYAQIPERVIATHRA